MRRFNTSVLLVSFCSVLAHAQLYTYPPTSVSTTGGTFNATTPVQNIILGLHAGVRSTTTFPLETTSSFTTAGIGYIAAYGTGTATLAFTMPGPVTIDRAYLWNAYFAIELDHSIEDMQIRFYDVSYNLLGSVSHTWPEAVAGVNTADSLMIDPPITDVVRVEVDVQSLHGGNDISMRRMAFAGSTLVAGLNDAPPIQAAVFPNPATDAVIVLIPDARQVALFDGAGREVQALAQRLADRVVLDVSALAAGTYHARISTANGQAHAHVLVER